MSLTTSEVGETSEIGPARKTAPLWLVAVSAIAFLLGHLLGEVSPIAGRILLGVSTGVLAAACVVSLALAKTRVDQFRLRRAASRAAANGPSLVLAFAADKRLIATKQSTGARAFRVEDVFADPALALRPILLRTLKEGGFSDELARGNETWSVEGRRAPGGALILLTRDAADTQHSVTKDAGTALLLSQSGQIEDLIGLAPMPPASMQQAIDALGGELSVGDVLSVSCRPQATFAVVGIHASGDGQRVNLLRLKGAAQSPDGLDQTIEILPLPVLKVLGDGTICQTNAAARDMLGLSETDETKLFDAIEGPGRAVSDWIADAITGRGLFRSEVVRATRPGRELFLQIALSRIEEDGETALLAVLTDATELKTLEAQFVQSQKMQAIGQLAGGVAHDFNNLLTAISGHADLMLLRHDEGDPDFGDLMQITQNANRAAALVGQLLAFSRKQTLLPEYLDLRDTMADLTHLLNRLVGEKIQLVLDHDPALQTVRADKRQFEQVIMNLVVNARDAMPDGGKIRIRTENRDLAVPMRRDRADVPAGPYVEITVEDEGSGISPEKLPKIFEPFYTSKKVGEGTGLGLSTAYGIVKQTGGFIFVESTPDTGTCFTILLPANTRPDTAAERPRATCAPAPVRAESGVVLLVEDEAPVRAFASRALKLRGHTVLEAGSAEEALEVLQDPRLAVDVFVTDVVMPGLDGPSWVKTALETRPDTRVIFVSGYAEDSVSEHQARIPNSVFLPKPFSLRDLTSTVQEQMASIH